MPVPGMARGLATWAMGTSRRRSVPPLRCPSCGTNWLAAAHPGSSHPASCRLLQRPAPNRTLPDMPASLQIVLPAYNEEARIGPALDELFAYLCGLAPGTLPESVKVLVVDDGSTDRTADVIRDRPEYTAEAVSDAGSGCRLKLLSVPHGGKGSAVRAGMLASDAEIVVFADADMATPPDQLPRMVAALETADVALGSRIQPDGSDMRASQPRFRRWIGRVFRFAAQLWVTGPVKDTQCGFKGFRGAVGRDLFGLLRVTSIVFDVDLIYLARRRGYRIAIVPVVWADRRGSRMHARPSLAARVAWDLIRIRFIHRGVKRVPVSDAGSRVE
jgi:dolichyl-phosphate beta-glucosyltransferase